MNEADEIINLRAEVKRQYDQNTEKIIRVAALEVENEKLRAALERLLRAKNEKDAHGDTPVYQALKAGAWDEARAVITQDMNDILAPKGTISEMIGTLRHLRAEVSELNELFDARWSADMRAIECWRKLNPGNDLVLPDHVNLCLWLMEERTRLRAEVERLRAALEEIIKRDDEWVPETQDDYSYTGYQVCADIARAALSASQPAQKAPAP